MSSIRAQIASAIDIIVQTQRLSDGGRRVVSISELTGMEGNVIQLQEIYHFVRREVTPEGKIIGDFRATGIRPRFAAGGGDAGPSFRQGCFQSAGAALMPTGQTLLYFIYVLAAASAILAARRCIFPMPGAGRGSARSTAG